MLTMARVGDGFLRLKDGVILEVRAIEIVMDTWTGKTYGMANLKGGDGCVVSVRNDTLSHKLYGPDPEWVKSYQPIN